MTNTSDLTDAAVSKTQWTHDILVPACPGDTTGFVVCSCDAPHIAASIVQSILTCDRYRPEWIKIVTRVVI